MELLRVTTAHNTVYTPAIHMEAPMKQSFHVLAISFFQQLLSLVASGTLYTPSSQLPSYVSMTFSDVSSVQYTVLSVGVVTAAVVHGCSRIVLVALDSLFVIVIVLKVLIVLRIPYLELIDVSKNAAELFITTILSLNLFTK